MVNNWVDWSPKCNFCHFKIIWEIHLSLLLSLHDMAEQELKVEIILKSYTLWCLIEVAGLLLSTTLISPWFLLLQACFLVKEWHVLYFPLVFNFFCMLHNIMMSLLHLWKDAMSLLNHPGLWVIGSTCLVLPPGFQEKFSMSTNTACLLLSTKEYTIAPNFMAVIGI